MTSSWWHNNFTKS